MKRISALVLCFVSAAAWANEASAMWTRLYRESVSMEHRYKLMQSIAAQHDRELVPVMTDALTDLVAQKENLANASQKVLWSDLAALIIGELANLKASEAAEPVYDVFRDQSNGAFLRAAAARALGDVGGRQYAAELSAALRTLNLDAAGNFQKEEAETLAGSLVYTLERFQDPQGFSPVFFASVKGYSKKVTDRARRAMVNMVEDPVDLLLDLMKAEASVTVRLSALEAGEASKAPGNRKLVLASFALEQAIGMTARDQREAAVLSQIRLKSASMFKQYGLVDPAAVALLGRMISGDYGLTESISAAETLGVSTLDEAAVVLAGVLDGLNKKRQSGYTFANESFVRTVIISLGNTGKPAGRPALTEVEFCDWSGDTRRAAKAALEKLP